MPRLRPAHSPIVMVNQKKEVDLNKGSSWENKKY